MPTETEIRWLPVREVGDVRMGKQLSPASREAAGQFPYLRVANVLRGRIDYTDVKTMGFSAAEREIYALQSGDILLNEGQSLDLVGRSAICDESADGFFYQNTLIRFRPGSQLLSSYAQAIFERWLETGVFAAIAKQTTSIAHLGGERFGSLKFPLPSIPDQRRIVEVIEAVSAQERAIAASIEKQRTARKAILSDVIESAVDVSAKKRTVSLGSVLSGIEAGWSPSCDTEPPGINEWGVVRVSAVSSGYFRPEESKRLPRELTPRQDLEIRPGDLIMARANGARNLVGTVCLVGRSRGRLMLSDKTLRLTPDLKAVRADFLLIALSADAVRVQIDSLLSGSTGQGNISQTAVQELMVPNMLLSKQRQIVELAKVLDEQIRHDQEELEKLRDLKHGLVADLLVDAGSVR
ncbi:restriction endonuclease subunit S [Streptomyces sp. TP-A0874]|uniref:restriction endonuclease subunit S n=1 Tax=Streptomyces sp. TP-A0874 TaxID=549819 RepID=UPI0008529194|nr:restriction endonuclease subunit S [Streptomyces sp. TP-A0874]